MLIGQAIPAAGQPSGVSQSTSREQPVATVGKFLAGAAAALAAHEAGHVVFDLVFDAEPGLKKVSFAGIPFFAITHRSGLSPRREVTISSAGFWEQHAGNEWLLRSDRQLRRSHAPFAKGVFAFNVLSSVAYSGAAFTRQGPIERDTRGIADSLGVSERWIGALILAPAILDVIRYVQPEAKWARWGSRSAKVAMVALVIK